MLLSQETILQETSSWRRWYSFSRCCRPPKFCISPAREALCRSLKPDHITAKIKIKSYKMFGNYCDKGSYSALRSSRSPNVGLIFLRLMSESLLQEIQDSSRLQLEIQSENKRKKIKMFYSEVTRFPSHPMCSHGVGEHGSSCHSRSWPVDCCITWSAETANETDVRKLYSE